MVNLTIDRLPVSVKEGTTLMEAAESIGIHIPHLCYWKGLNEIAACRVCVVELEGRDHLITACNTKVEEGMVIYTNSPKVRLDRRLTVQLILSQHDCRCATCVRSGNCSLQKIATDLNVQDGLFEERLEKQPWDKTFPLIRQSEKCIKCMRCVQVCDKIQSLNIWDLEGTGSRSTINVTGNRTINEADCSLCGQCITHCPVGALHERDDTEKLWRALADPNKTVVVQVAPAVRAAWGEDLGFTRKEATIGKIFDALKKMGADYVFDSCFTADLTIMEEANELLVRLGKGELKDRPMFTSCCPGWVRFVKSEFPQFVKQLSTAKSPMQMFGAVMKSYFAEQIGKKPEDIFSVAIMPCLAKKGEANMELFYKEYAGHDTDCVITTRELIRMIKGSSIITDRLTDIEPDRIFHDASGAGVIFGATGGVMEAALRTAVETLTGEELANLEFTDVRGTKGIKEAEYQVAGMDIRVAVASGLGNARELLNQVKSGEKQYHFIEIMGCPGGCVNGGGQPQVSGDVRNFTDVRGIRASVLYRNDQAKVIRKSHENPAIKKLYEEYLGEPGSKKAHETLHTTYVKRTVN